MERDNRRERPMLASLRRFRQYTEVVGQILRDLWPLVAVAFSILGVALHQLG